MATVYPLKRVANRAHNASIPDTDSIISRSIVADPAGAGGAASLWSDSKTTTVNIGTGSTQTAFTIGGGGAYTGTTIGKSGVVDTHLGDLTVNGSLKVNGTVTTVNATSITTQDQVLTIALTNRATAAANAVFAVYRGSAGGGGKDALVYWTEASTRFDFGIGDTGTLGGTLPSAPTTWADVKLKNLALAGTAITADAGLTVSATAAALNLQTTTSGAINLTSAGALVATSSGTSSWTNTSGNLTIATATSGTLGLNSAAAISSTAATTAAFSAGTTMSVSGTTATTVTATGATADLTFHGRGQSYTFNDASNITFSGGITATSIVGAINQVYAGSGSATTVANMYTNNTGSTIVLGSAVYITTTASNIDKSTATSDAAAAQFIGLVKADIPDTTTGVIISEGVANATFEASLTLVNGNEVFLSASTAGYLTNVAPSATGKVVLSVGFLKDVSAYTGAAGDLASVQLVRGSKSVV